MSLPRLIRKNPVAFGVTIGLLSLIIVGVGVTIFKIIPQTPPQLDPIQERLQQGLNYLQIAEYEKAKEEFQAALEIRRDSADAWYGLGMVSEGLGEYEDQFKYCQTSTVLNPDLPAPWNCLGVALHRQDRDEEAVEAFDTAINLFENNGEELYFKIIATINKGESLLDQKSLGPAIETLKTALELGANNNIENYNFFANSFLGRAYREKGDFNLSLEAYEEAVLQEPTYFIAQVGRLITLNQMKANQRIVADVDELLNNKEQYPKWNGNNWAKILYQKGLAFENGGECDRARAAYQEANQYDPDYEWARQQLTTGKCSQ